MTPLRNLKHILKTTLLFTLLLCAHSLISQEKNNPDEIENEYKGTLAEKVKTKFNKPQIEISKSGLVSNVLNIINTTQDNLNFTLDVLLPNDWSSIIDPDKIYNVSVKDTIVIPILLIPSKVKTGSSEIIINTFLLDLDGQQIGDNSFILKTKKKVKWDLGVKTANKFYFKNEEFNKKFEYSIINKGNYKQDIAVHHQIPKKDLYLTDTTNIDKKITKDNSITLDVGEEADFSYYASAIQLNERNKRKVSNTTYTPYENKYFKKYDLVINSTEDRSSNETLYKKTAKVSFVKLPNEIEMQSYGYPSLPLTIDMYIQNILSENPFMSINFRGIKNINDNASLIYNTTLNFSQSYYNPTTRQEIPWYVGYFDDKKSVEVGQVFSNIIGIISSGNGVKASYRLNDHNSFTGFYIQSKNDISKATNASYGLTHNFYTNIFSLTSQIGRNDNKINGTTTDIISLRPRLRLFKTNIFDFFVSKSLTTDNITQTKKEGFLYSAGFSSTIARKIKFNVNGRYTDPNFGTSSIERLNLSHRTSYQINSKWSTFFNNNYQKTITPISNNTANFYQQQLLFNRFAVSRKVKFGSIQNGIYYDIRDFLNRKIHTRGLSYNVSTFSARRNLQTSYILRAGYTKEILETPTDNHFSFDFTSLVRYRIWNFTLKYNYGDFTSNNTQVIGGKFVTPQLFRVSAQNQYTFKNRRFILETNTSYTYRNIAKNNSFGINPELFYFSKTNWRFSLQMSYFYNSTDYSDIIDIEDANRFSPNRNTKSQSSNLTIGMSIRKEIGVPIPFAKKKTSNVTFIAFKDTNGNGVKDRSEQPINNVVINFDKREVITSSNGAAKINNAAFGRYAFDVLPLEDLKGWFPNIQDSISIGRSERQYIPFVRGVKLYGDVIIDRQKIAVSDDKPMDLSRIKITASKDKNYSTLTDENGHFEFYLPNGEYILNMDESILSSSLRLSRNNIPVVLKNLQDGYYISFYILEKRRKVIIRDFSKKKR